MDTELGRLMILWTVRISVALYAIALWRYLFGDKKNTSVDATYAWSWTASWLMCLVHVVCAYHFQHHWNQAVALQHTAEMTNKVVGIYWSGGLYVNYVFLTLWGIDVMSTWRSAVSGNSWGLHTVAAFMMFNATVVFGPRWWCLPVGLFLAAVALNFVRQRRRSGESHLTERA